MNSGDGVCLLHHVQSHASVGQFGVGDVMAREAQWTESIAVGSRAFVEAIGQTIRHREKLTGAPVSENAWGLRVELLLRSGQTA